MLTIEFTLDVDGKEVKDGGGKGVQLELGSGQALPELDAGAHGAKRGDKARRPRSTFPDAHARADFRGKKAVFHVTVSDVKERILPALDDEFAKDIGQFETLVALRADIHIEPREDAEGSPRRRSPSRSSRSSTT